MGRERAPVKGEGLGAELAQRLRRLRDDSGLSLRQLSERTGYSQAVLSTAESGSRTPTWEVVAAFVTALGEKPAAWRQLWELARGQWHGPPPAMPLPNGSQEPPADAEVPSATASSDESAKDAPSEAARRRLIGQRGRWILISASAAVLGVLGLLVAVMLSSGHSATARQVADGQDPRKTRCDQDARTLAVTDVDAPAAFQDVLGQLSARYSPTCHAVWGRFDPTPVLDRMAPHARLTITAERPADHRSSAFALTYVGALTWGNMLRTTPGCVSVAVLVSDPAFNRPVTAQTRCVSGEQ